MLRARTRARAAGFTLIGVMAALAILAIVASATMLLAALAALAQDDYKRVLAWSTSSQLAYMLGALAVGGYSAGLFHLLAHGAFKVKVWAGCSRSSRSVP